MQYHHLLLLTVGSAYRTGPTKIRRREPWVVVERFCFEGRSTLDYSIKTTGGTRMYVYGSRDQKSFREKVDKKSYQTMSMQKRFERADTEVVLTPGMTTSGDLKFAVDSGQTFVHVVIANFNASCNAICVDQFSCNAEFSKRGYGPVRDSSSRMNLNLPGSWRWRRRVSFRAGRGRVRHDVSRRSVRARAGRARCERVVWRLRGIVCIVCRFELRRRRSTRPRGQKTRDVSNFDEERLGRGAVYMV